MVIEATSIPVSEAVLQRLRDHLQLELGDTYQVVVGGWNGMRELRESADPVRYVEIFFDALVAVAAVASAVRAWRGHK